MHYESLLDKSNSLRSNEITPQQEINDFAVNDAFLIGDHAGNVGLNDDALEEIVCATKRIRFRNFFFVFRHLPCGLDIHALIAAVDDKIYFLLLVLAVPPVCHDAHIHGVPAAQQFHVNHVFHHMSRIDLSKAEPRRADLRR